MDTDTHTPITVTTQGNDVHVNVNNADYIIKVDKDAEVYLDGLVAMIHGRPLKSVHNKTFHHPTVAGLESCVLSYYVGQNKNRMAKWLKWKDSAHMDTVLRTINVIITRNNYINRYKLLLTQIERGIQSGHSIKEQLTQAGCDTTALGIDICADIHKLLETDRSKRLRTN